MAPVLTLLCAGCEAGPNAKIATHAPPAAATEVGYAEAPQIVSIREAGGGMAITGAATPRSEIRLASPGGRAFSATADDQGRWSISAPRLSEGALYGLSSRHRDRTVQAEGYVVLLPPAPGAPLGALLRAGAGAALFGPATSGAAIEALDIDAARAAIISGVAAPGSVLKATIDGVAAGDGAAGGDHRFFLPLVRPVEPGQRQLLVDGPSGTASAEVDVQAPKVPAQGPFQVQRVPGAWRIVWITPGGGLQATYLLDRQGAGV